MSLRFAISTLLAMYQYRIFKQAGRAIRFVGSVVAAGLLAASAALGLMLYLVLEERRPGLGVVVHLVFAAALLAVWIAFRQRTRRRVQLGAVRLTVREHSPHRRLKAALQHHILCGRRLATQPSLPPDVVAVMFQAADDLQATVDHHPLRDDLFRGLQQAHAALFAPAYQHLDTACTALAATKAASLLQDLYQPPFPVITPLVALYHQVTLVSAITELYLPETSRREYHRVIADTWAVMTEGDFIRHGQRFFAGLEAGADFGPASVDLGQAVSVVWITHCVARVAAQRCRTLHDWTVKRAIAAQRAQELPCLLATRDTLAREGLPVLKAIFRRHAPPGPPELRRPVDENTAYLLKALDAVMMTMNTGGRGTGRTP